MLEDVLWRTMCVNAADSSGKTAMDMALEQNDEQAVELLRAALVRSQMSMLGI